MQNTSLQNTSLQNTSLQNTSLQNTSLQPYPSPHHTYDHNDLHPAWFLGLLFSPSGERP
ncbi:pentapeptide repeat-containing protein [Bacteroides xylanisolvens]|uniref:pentapeptide repeat-containing protein n=1 Tax=Bacteroides xylanisolvens TaxID=371601 RepID=UPI00189EF371